MGRIISLLTFLCLMIIALDNVCQAEIIKADNHFFVKESPTNSDANFIVFNITPEQKDSNPPFYRLCETYEIIKKICIEKGYKEVERKYYDNLIEGEKYRKICITEKVFVLKIEQRISNQRDRFDYSNPIIEMRDTPMVYCWWNIFYYKKLKIGDSEHSASSLEQIFKWTSNLNECSEKEIIKRVFDLVDEET